MDTRAIVRNKKTGKEYKVTKVGWRAIQAAFGSNYVMVKDFPPDILPEDLPEIKELRKKKIK